MAEALTRGARITGAERQELGARLARRYADGESIRAIAQDTGRSFGFVHGLIKESGVPVRARGGATRGSAAAGTQKGEAVKAETAATKPGKRVKAKKPDKHDDGKRSKKGKKR